jgi:hypothetical protein
MVETLPQTTAPSAELPAPAPGGIILDNTEWDSTFMRPPPAFITEAAPSMEPRPLEASLPIYPQADGWEKSGSNAEKGELILKRENLSSPSGYEIVRVNASQYKEAVVEEPPKAPEAEPEAIQRPNVSDSSGQEWQYLGSTENGMHRIQSPDGFHTKHITDEQFQQLTPIGTESDTAAQPPTAEEPTPSDDQREHEPNPEQQDFEKVHRQNIDPRFILKLKSKIEEIYADDIEKTKKPTGYVGNELIYEHLKALGVETLANGDFTQEGMALLFDMSDMVDLPEKTLQSLIDSSNSNEPVIEIQSSSQEQASDIEPNIDSLNKPEVVKLIDRLTKQIDKLEIKLDELEKSASKNAKAPKTAAEAKSLFSEKFRSVRDELLRLSGSAKNNLAEKTAIAKDAFSPMADGLRSNAEYMAGSAKEALSNTLMMEQVVGEKVGGAGIATAQSLGGNAKEGLVSGILAGQVVGEKIVSKAEATKAYRRRLIGKAIGSASILQSLLFGPSETDKKDAKLNDEHGWNL